MILFLFIVCPVPLMSGALADVAAPPEDPEACFSPDEACGAKLEKFMDSAKVSIDIAAYDIDLPDLVERLVQKSKKIRVRIVTDSERSSKERSGISRLVKSGVQVRFGRQKGHMHNKFTIVDGTKIQTGSFNYTRHGDLRNQENQIYLANPRIVQRYKNRFEKIWESSDTR